MVLVLNDFRFCISQITFVARKSKQQQQQNPNKQKKKQPKTNLKMKQTQKMKKKKKKKTLSIVSSYDLLLYSACVYAKLPLKLYLVLFLSLFKASSV